MNLEQAEAEILRLRDELAKAEKQMDLDENRIFALDQEIRKAEAALAALKGRFNAVEISRQKAEASLAEANKQSLHFESVYLMERDKSESLEVALAEEKKVRESLEIQMLLGTPSAELLRRTIDAEEGKKHYMALVSQAQEHQTLAERDRDSARQTLALAEKKLAVAVGVLNNIFAQIRPVGVGALFEFTGEGAHLGSYIMKKLAAIKDVK